MLARFGIVCVLPAKSNMLNSTKIYETNNKQQIIDNFSKKLEVIENFLLEHSRN